MHKHKFNIIIPPQDIAVEPGLQLKLADGDRDAFAWVYKNYCRKVYDYANLLTGCTNISEDIVQEVFIQLWLNKEKLKFVKNFNGYFYVLYRSYILEVLRKKKTHVTENLETIHDDAMTPLQRIEYKELEQAIQQTVQQLSPQRKLVFALQVQGYKVKAISKVLNVFPSTAKSHVKFVRKMILQQVVNDN